MHRQLINIQDIQAQQHNAILQGQFRHSDLTNSRDQLQPLIVELWAGYTHEFERRLALSAFIRARNQEIDVAGLDDPVWGGFIVSKSF